MKKMYGRTILREIKQSLGRFAAIIAIVALGVGFLIGILSSTPDMKASVDRYYRDSAMSDFDIKSTMGLTEKDLSALRSLPQIKDAMPAYATDTLVTANSGAILTGRIYGMDLENQSVNRLALRSGRMPKAKNECVIESPNDYMVPLKPGDTLTFSSESQNPKDTYTVKSLTITGIVDSPYYFCNSKEPASAGNGRAGVIAYADESIYKLEAYTDIFLTLKQQKAAFSQGYETLSDQAEKELKALSGPCIQARYDEIVRDAKKELAKGKQTLAREKKKAKAELRRAKKKLDKAEKQLNDGTDGINQAKQQMASGKQELQQGQAQINQGRKEIARGKKELDKAKKQLDAAKSQVDQAKAALAAGAELPQEALDQIAEYDRGLAAWKKGTADLKKQEDALNAAQANIDNNRKKLRSGKQEIKANEKKLKDARTKLDEARLKYEDGKIQTAAEIANAEREFKKAEDKIRNMKKPKWYILDRNSNPSYARYKIDVEKVAAVATVFPIFFFLVAALVALTTMTRMVEEERIQIGTLKALGYRRSTIMSKYLIYCGAATVLGCAIGIAAGFRLLPTAIYNAYAAQYDLPDLILNFNGTYAFISCGLELLCTLGATWFACSRTLKEKPANLMIPRAPKAGKRIFLERIGFLWKHLSFSHKATARNIFRYKKHLFMTIVGIAGCTALMVAGFGLQDSMSEIVKTQYHDIFKYDTRLELAEDKTDETIDQFLSGKNHLKISNTSVEVSGSKNKEKISTTLCVPQAGGRLADFIDLRNPSTKEQLPLSTSSAIMTEKMADVLELSVGDTFTVMNPDEAEAAFTLTGITENYVGCYLYMDRSLYAQAFGTPEYNGYLLTSSITDSARQDQVTQELQDSDYISSVEFTSQSQDNYETLLSSINLIVYILILCAGALAVVVLYNLTNININERSRELATLRVLGYHHSEVCAYIFREIGLLSILGTVTGLFVGKAFHYYVVVTAESVDMMMGRDISISSYLLAALITLAFSALVDVLMSFKLRKIQMVESMKAVD